MYQLKSAWKLGLVAAGALALAACSSTTASTTSDYTTVSNKADQALATAQRALQEAQQAEADAKASNQQTSMAYQRSLRKGSSGMGPSSGMGTPQQ
jgi:hypothetical protein